MQDIHTINYLPVVVCRRAPFLANLRVGLILLGITTSSPGTYLQVMIGNELLDHFEGIFIYQF